MRTIKYLLLGVILIVIVVVALANRATITLHLLPPGLDRVASPTLNLPLFAVILASVVVGMVVGYLFEWLREHKHRRRASRKAQEADRLSREVERLRKDTGRPTDDVLALIGG
jgi:lipopolysaccharide assembly protein A